jgi:hypothetical protein
MFTLQVQTEICLLILHFYYFFPTAIDAPPKHDGNVIYDISDRMLFLLLPP